MPTTGLWLTYDMGIRGDYEGLYAFLDDHEALECGDSVAFLEFDHSGDVIGEFTEAIKQAVEFDKRSRVYVICKVPGAGYKGRFVIGKRKSPAWSGFGSIQSVEEDVSE